MFSYNKFIILILLLNCVSAIAGDIEVDLRLDVSIEETDNVQFGQIIPLSITVSNLGPDDAGSTSTSLLPNRVFTGFFNENSNGYPNIIIYKDNSMKQDCFILTLIGEPPRPRPGVPPSPPGIAYTIRLPAIPAHASTTCYIKAQILFQHGSSSIPFNSVPIRGDIDIDLSNNEKEIVFTIKPAIIPALNMFTLLLLFCLVFVVGLKHIMKPIN